DGIPVSSAHSPPARRLHAQDAFLVRHPCAPPMGGVPGPTGTAYHRKNNRRSSAFLRLHLAAASLADVDMQIYWRALVGIVSVERCPHSGQVIVDRTSTGIFISSKIRALAATPVHRHVPRLGSRFGRVNGIHGSICAAVRCCYVV